MNLDRAPKIIYSRYSEPNLKKALDEILAGLPFGVSRETFRQLSSALFERQRSVLLLGVEADLKLFSNKKILYLKLSRVKEEELQKILDDAAKVGEFDPSPAEATSERSHRDAYRYYCDNILSPVKGIYHFLSRNPNAGMLLDRVTLNFVGNVRECLTRLRADKYVLERVFLDGGTVKTLQAITHPGSDSHGGGKQVLFLDFAYQDRQGKDRKKRIVYKPSDVEIDYRLAGKNTPELKQVLEEKYSDAGFPFPHESLFELLDRRVFKQINEDVVQKSTRAANEKERLREQLLLPTYTILPRNPGSRLKPRAETQLPIDTSYGYLEYLEHEPRIPEKVGPGVIEEYVRRQRRWKFRDRQHTNADWIIEEPIEAFPCFRLWGRLMTIACVFLQTDLHFKHQIIRRRKPHLVDFENGLVKTCPTPLETLIAGNLRTTTGAPKVLFEFKLSDRNLSVPVKATPIRPEIYRLNQIYLRRAKNGSVVAKHISTDDYLSQMYVVVGITETLRGMRTVLEEIAQWVQAVSLADVVVRHVVQDTPTFTAAIHQFTDVLLKAENRLQQPKEILAAFMRKRRKKAVNHWRKEGKDNNNPYYALEVPRYNGKAFENLEVPVYYRRVGSRDLLTVKGEVVTYLPQAGDDNGLRFDHYYHDKGMDLLADSLQEKLSLDDDAMEDKVVAFVDNVYPRIFKLSDYVEGHYIEPSIDTGSILLPSVKPRQGHANINRPGVVCGWSTNLPVQEALEHLAEAWPLYCGGGRVAVFLIDMDQETANEKEAKSVVKQQINVLTTAKKKKLDIFEVWTAGKVTAKKLREVLRGYQKCHRFNKKSGGSCFRELVKLRDKQLAEVMIEKQVGLALVMGFDTNYCVEASIFGNAAVPQAKNGISGRFSGSRYPRSNFPGSFVPAKNCEGSQVGLLFHSRRAIFLGSGSKEDKPSEMINQ